MEDSDTGPDHPHWDKVYTSKGDQQLSWFQADPERSLRMVLAAVGGDRPPVIDIGAGQSSFLARLWDHGFTDLTALDISAAAVERARERLASTAADGSFIVADITTWQPERRYGVWHDRAVFHFLTDEADQSAYVNALAAGLPPGGVALLATFAPDGPDRCSGLPVQRYDADTLAARLGSRFALRASEREVHTTPWGAEQRFSYACFVRTDG